MSSAPQQRPPGKVLNIDNINASVKAAKYAVRGEIAIKSDEYRDILARGQKDKLPFDSVISANIGNPQQLDQKPITFFRQVASLLENPLLLEHEDVLVNSLDYKPDVIERAKKLLADVQSVGAYSQSQGAPIVRESVARFIEGTRPPASQDRSAKANAQQNETATLRTPRTSSSVPELRAV